MTHCRDQRGQIDSVTADDPSLSLDVAHPMKFYTGTDFLHKLSSSTAVRWQLAPVEHHLRTSSGEGGTGTASIAAH